MLNKNRKDAAAQGGTTDSAVENAVENAVNEAVEAIAPATRTTGKRPSAVKRKYFVLDTNVLLHNAGSIFKFAEHEVVIPVVVITELESKRTHPELGYFARF